MSRADGPDGASGVLELRRFGAGDTRAVRALHDLALDEAAVHPVRGPCDEDLDPTTYLDDGEFLVGLCDGRLIAIGALRHVTDKAAELKRMRVHPTFQRRGFARLILIRLEQRARELGYRELRLDTTMMQTSLGVNPRSQ